MVNDIDVEALLADMGEVEALLADMSDCETLLADADETLARIWIEPPTVEQLKADLDAMDA